MKISVCFQVVPNLLEMTPAEWPDSPAVPPGAHCRRQIDAYDESALETALRVRDEHPDTELTAVTISAREDRRIFEMLFALGFSHVLRVEEDPLPFASARKACLLAEAVRGSDFILAGSRSGLGGSGKTPRLLAGALGLPYVDGVTELHYRDGALQFLAVRGEEQHKGLASGPAVLMIGEGGWLRVPTLRQRAAVSSRRAEVTDPAALLSGLPLPKEEFPVLLRPLPEHPPCRFLNGSREENATAVASLFSDACVNAQAREAADLRERLCYGGMRVAVYESEQPPLPMMAGDLSSFRDLAACACDKGAGLTRAEKVLVLGRGAGGEDNLRRAEQCAQRLGASVGATRAAVMNGWFPPACQVGISGLSLAGRCVLVLGASGAGAFTAGLENCGTVIAVNSDPKAPIFQRSDYGIVCDCGEFLQALLKA